MHFSSDDRHILVITGEQAASVAFAQNISRELESVEIPSTNNASRFLGRELDVVIFDLHQDFDANAFGAISGAIRGGGFLILLKPNTANTSSLFLKRFYRILEHTSKVQFLDITHQEKVLLPNPPRKTYTEIYATEDQEQAVNAIMKVVTGHRRRPLVITSDRGRGKSASLGIAVTELAKHDINHIILCAPSKKAAEIVFKHAGLSATDAQANLTFYSPDELHQQKPKADLVLIDEAAAIPLPMLSDFLKNHSRIVFASTQHGYEGCGRGFAINFRKVLNNEAPEWNSCELKTPIRWELNDTLEKFTFDALLLNAELSDQVITENISLSDCNFKYLNKQKLVENNNKLKQLFGILVSAHYQTKPSDLKQMLDDDSVTIACLETKETVVAVALIIAEGNINPELTDDIFQGKRRLQGHLVAQALSSNIGIESAIELSGERISRIAVHPQLQSKGFGSDLINILFEKSQADYLSTCYGATESLLSFWKKIGFKAVHLGIKRDASSGSHSVTMLRAKTQNGIKLSEQAQSIFNKSFPQLLSVSFNTLETEIVISLLSSSDHQLNPDDMKRLSAFAYASRGYENSQYLLWELVLAKLANRPNLNDAEKKILIMKVLQKQSWDEIKLRIANTVSGKKEALVLLRRATSRLLPR